MFYESSQGESGIREGGWKGERGGLFDVSPVDGNQF